MARLNICIYCKNKFNSLKFISIVYLQVHNRCLILHTFRRYQTPNIQHNLSLGKSYCRVYFLSKLTWQQSICNQEPHSCIWILNLKSIGCFYRTWFLEITTLPTFKFEFKQTVAPPIAKLKKPANVLGLFFCLLFSFCYQRLWQLADVNNRVASFSLAARS